MPANGCTSSCCAARPRRSATPTRGMRGLKRSARAARNRSQQQRWSAGLPRDSANASRKPWSASGISSKTRAPKASSRAAKLYARRTSAKASAQSARRRWLSPGLTIRARRPRMANSWPSKSMEPVTSNSTQRICPTSSNTTVSPRRSPTFCKSRESPRRHEQKPVAQVRILNLRLVKFFRRVILFASGSLRRTQRRGLFNQDRRARKREIPRNIVHDVDLAHVEAGLKRLQRQIDLENHRFAVRRGNFIRHDGL